MSSISNREEQKRLAYELYKYQNVSNSLLNLFVNSSSYARSSLYCMKSNLRTYLNTGRKNLSRLSEDFYNAIDDAKQRGIEIYQPDEVEKGRPFRTKKNYRKPVNSYFQPSLTNEPFVKTTNKLNISKETLDKIKGSQNSYYGLRLEQSLKIFNSLEERTGYIRAYNEIDPNMTFQKVRIEVKEEN